MYAILLRLTVAAEANSYLQGRWLAMGKATRPQPEFGNDPF